MTCASALDAARLRLLRLRGPWHTVAHDEGAAEVVALQLLEALLRRHRPTLVLAWLEELAARLERGRRP